MLFSYFVYQCSIYQYKVRKCSVVFCVQLLVCVVIGCGCATDDYIEMIGTANLSKTV